MMLRKIASASAVVTAATVITLVCSIVSFGLNARALGLQAFGQLALVQALFSFVGGLTTFDNWQPIVRLGIRSPDKLGLAIGSGVLLDAWASLSAAVIGGVAVLMFSARLGVGDISGLFLLPYCLSLLAGLSGTPKGYFRLNGRFDLLAFNTISAGLLYLGASVALWYFEAPLEAYLLVLGTANAVPGIVLVVVMVTHLRRQGLVIVSPLGSQSRRRYLKTFFRMAAGNSVLSTLTTSRHQIVLFIVSGMSGAAAAGLFAAASRCANALTKFFVPVSQIIFPEILRIGSVRSPTELRRTMRRITLVAGGCASVVITAAVFVSGRVIVIAAGPEFVGAAHVLALLVAAEVLLWASFHFNPFILSTVGQMPLLKMNLAIAIPTVGVAVVMVHKFDQLGGGGAVLFGALCTYVALSIIARREIIRMTAVGPNRAV